LHLYRPDLGTNSVYAAFDYLDGGSVVNSFTFTQTADIFHGENYTQALFRAASPVPLPGAFWLFASGIAGLLGLKLKNKKFTK